ncbi:MAG: two-component system response regulator [Bacteroidetes bacterium GWF2_38_335]|nr:MAG: two-component system response regulator [Bacteroidetes bacterium GWF2_38_335]OFY77035.1 MAG: two-component system response regulator [Bacteroidetes bacterium RIFOXYA12_FULL_38_20]HBS86893.1 DNA-binding response regulator [Bacteroidales bacterium]
MKTRILYVEDEPFLGKIVRETLESQGFEVYLVADGAKVISMVGTTKPDICVLDVMLPNVNGFTLGKQIKGAYPHLPVIFLTAKVETEDIITGFNSGGTDYIRKPFSVKELIVRINNQLKLAKHTSHGETKISGDIALGKVVFKPDIMELHVPGEVIKLSSRESEILTMLISGINECVERKTILKTIWGDDSFFNSRNLDVYIRKIRGYLSAEPGIEILTLKGKGYRVVCK